MHLWCKTSQNIWPLFSKYLPLHHLTPEWWNGRHEGLKIPWPLRLYEFESRFRHFPSVELLSRREFFLLFLSPPYMYMGWYCPKEGKNNEKLTYCFVDMWKLICQPCKIIVYDFLVRVRTCARLPTAMLFFCCHKCHTPRKKWTKKQPEIQWNARNKTLFPILFHRTNPTRITSLLIFIQSILAMSWKPVEYNIFVTLVTAKKQKLLWCVRARTRERMVL